MMEHVYLANGETMTKQKAFNPEFEKVDQQTGEITPIGKEALNKVIIKETLRPNGTVRIQQDFSNCPTLTQQGLGHLTDINYLIEKYKPDELQAYINQRNERRREIVGHDFSQEPSMQDAKNIVYRSSQEFENLDEDIKRQFRSHVEFLKFIDNPANAEKMVKMGILKPEQVENLQSLEPVTTPTTQTTTTKEAKEKKE